MDSDDLLTEQPMPIPTGAPSVQEMVLADIHTRMQVGVERYGTLLQPGNGRDALRDAYEEAIDLSMYLRQAIAERPREDVDAAVAEVRAELEPQLNRQTDLIAEMRRQLEASTTMRDRYWETAKRVPGMEHALSSALSALEVSRQSCRFHGTDFGAMGMEYGQPRCESCRVPYKVTVAIRDVGEALGEVDRG